MCPPSWVGARVAGKGRRVGVKTYASRDFYQILGVDRGADKKTIKSAYRQLARKFHPDVNKDPDSEARFKDISAAYEVLADEEKKSIYDRFGEDGLKGGGMGAGFGGMASDFTNPMDIFESFFGGSMGGMGGMGGWVAWGVAAPGCATGPCQETTGATISSLTSMMRCLDARRRLKCRDWSSVGRATGPG